MAYSDTPTISGSYGPYTQNKFDLYRHPDGALPGGNPILMWIHGGGWSGGNHREVQSTAAANQGQTLANYFGTTGRAPRFDLMSIEYRCGNTTIPGTPATGLHFQRAWYGLSYLKDIQQAIQFVNAKGSSLGCRNSCVVAGYSAGGTGIMHNAFRPRPRCTSRGIAPGFWRFDVTSEPAAAIPISSVIDVGYDGPSAFVAPAFTYNLVCHPNSTAGAEASDKDFATALSPRRLIRPVSTPVHCWYQATGPQTRPYANPHAQEQAAEMMALMRGLSHDWTCTVSTNNPLTAGEAGTIFDWVKSRVGTTS